MALADKIRFNSSGMRCSLAKKPEPEGPTLEMRLSRALAQRDNATGEVTRLQSELAKAKAELGQLRGQLASANARLASMPQRTAASRFAGPTRLSASRGILGYQS
jgi:chromosome segregation ATPase